MLQAPLLVFLQALWPHLLQYEMLLMLGIMEAKFVALCTHCYFLQQTQTMIATVS